MSNNLLLKSLGVGIHGLAYASAAAGKFNEAKKNNPRISNALGHLFYAGKTGLGAIGSAVNNKADAVANARRLQRERQDEELKRRNPKEYEKVMYCRKWDAQEEYRRKTRTNSFGMGYTKQPCPGPPKKSWFGGRRSLRKSRKSRKSRK